MTNSSSSDSIKLPPRIQGLIAPIEDALNNNDAGQASVLLHTLWYDENLLGYYRNSPDVNKKLVNTSQEIISKAAQNKNEDELATVSRHMLDALYLEDESLLKPKDGGQRFIDDYPEITPLYDACLDIRTDNTLKTAAKMVKMLSDDTTEKFHDNYIDDDDNEVFDLRMGKAIDDVFHACMMSGSISAFETALDLSHKIFDNVVQFSWKQNVAEKIIRPIGYVCEELIHINTDESLKMALDKGISTVADQLSPDNLGINEDDGKIYSDSLKFLAHQCKDLFYACPENSQMKADAFIQYANITCHPECAYSWNVEPEDAKYDNKIAQKDAMGMFTEAQKIFDTFC